MGSVCLLKTISLLCIVMLALGSEALNQTESMGACTLSVRERLMPSATNSLCRVEKELRTAPLDASKRLRPCKVNFLADRISC